jgi:thiamine-monophosphate kinase
MGEFELIERVFQTRFAALSKASPQVALGIGDDCALLQPTPGMQLAVSTDTLVEGRHFLSTVPPEALGHKALAVNLSDLAACGAKPLGFLLSLTAPRVHAAWLQDFANGLLNVAAEHACPLVGGNTAAGPLAIGITVFGEVPPQQALLRSGAKPGYDIYVSGFPGEARAALEVFRGHVTLTAEQFAHARSRMERPTPRVALGLALRGIASSAIDLSDGLLGDLAHVVQASGVHAEVDLDLLDAIYSVASNPMNVLGYCHFFSKNGEAAVLSDSQRHECMLFGGDDYELALTAPRDARQAVQAAALAAQTPLHRIGQICANQASGADARQGLARISLLRQGKASVNAQDGGLRSFDHFLTPACPTPS